MTYQDVQSELRSRSRTGGAWSATALFGDVTFHRFHSPSRISGFCLSQGLRNGETSPDGLYGPLPVMIGWKGKLIAPSESIQQIERNRGLCCE